MCPCCTLTPPCLQVQDAASLLDCVPLVCRRWRRLSRACWADADLRLPYWYAGHGRLIVRKEHARLLLHAPPAGRLRLSLEFVNGYAQTWIPDSVLDGNLACCKSRRSALPHCNFFLYRNFTNDWSVIFYARKVCDFTNYS